MKKISLSIILIGISMFHHAFCDETFTSVNTSVPTSINSSYSFQPVSGGSITPSAPSGVEGFGNQDIRSEVSNNGALTYTYPINLPKGTNGMGPELSVTYNSAAPNGWLGIGFILNGFSCIERDPAWPINFDGSDHYILDGERLIFSKADSSFHPEREDYSSIIAYSAGTTITSAPNQASSYWIIKKQDGRRYYYGETNDSRIMAVGKTSPRVWALNKVEDSLGNFYTIEYTVNSFTEAQYKNFGGDYYPIKITYTKNSATNTYYYNTVEFAWEPRHDRITKFIPTGVTMNGRLKYIVIKGGPYGTSLIREYRFDYLDSGSALINGVSGLVPINGPSQCVSIRELGSDAEIPNTGPFMDSFGNYYNQDNSVNSLGSNYDVSGSISPEKFTNLVSFRWYSEPNMSSPPLGSIAVDFQNSGFQQSFQSTGRDPVANIIQGDFNGDGRLDFIRQGYTTQTIGSRFQVCISNGDGTFAIKEPFSVEDQANLSGCPPNGNGGSILTAGDFNGDGKTDFIRQKMDVTVGDTTAFQVYLSNGDGSFQRTTPFDYTNYQYSLTGRCGKYYSSITDYRYGATLVSGDFDGDGKTDFIRQEWGPWPTDNISNLRVYYNFSQEKGTFSIKDLSSSEYQSFFLGVSTYNPNGSELNACDINGDGITDFFASSKDSNIASKAFISNGDNSFKAVSTLSISPISLMGDFNGDGKVDKCGIGYDSTGATIGVLLGVGDGTFTSGGSFSFDYARNIVIGDYNGDGLSDILVQRSYSINGNNQIIYISNGDGTFYATGGYFPNNLSIPTLDSYPGNGYFIYPGDYNGDGSTDFIRIKIGPWTSEPDPRFLVYLLNTDSDNKCGYLVKEIVPPSGGIISAEYQPIIDTVPATEATISGNQVARNMSAGKVVSRLTRKVGCGSPDIITDYSYYGALVSTGKPYERRSLGFASITEVTGETQKTTDYYQDIERRGLPVRETVSERIMSSDGKSIVSINPMRQTEYHYKSSIRTDYPGSYCLELTSKYSKTDYSGNQNGLFSYKTYRYGSDGLLTDTFDYGICNSTFSDTSIKDNKHHHIDYQKSNNDKFIIWCPIHDYTESYDENGVLGIDTDTIYKYDNRTDQSILNGLVTSVIRKTTTSVSATEKFSYDIFGNVTGYKTPEAVAHNWNWSLVTEYDSKYNCYPVKITDALNQIVSSITYDDRIGIYPQNKYEMTGGNTTYTYDRFGRLSSEVLEGDAMNYPTVSYLIDDSKSPHSVTIKRYTGSSFISSITYRNGIGKVVQEKKESEGGLWYTVDYFYDKTGNLSALSIPYNTSSSAYSQPDLTKQRTSWEYDSLGRITKRINTDTSSAQTIYQGLKQINVDENKHAVITVLGVNTVATSRLQGVYDGSNPVYSTTTVTNARGIKILSDNNENAVVTRSDMLGRITRRESPDNGTWWFEYDLNGNLTRKTDANGVATNYSYDAINKLLKIDYPNDPDVTYTYSKGQVGTVIYNRGKDSYCYDTRGRIAQIERTLDGITRYISYTYDSRNQIMSESYSRGRTSYYTYNSLRYLSSIPGVVSEIIYTESGKVSSMLFGNSIRQTYDYYDTASEKDPSSGLIFSNRLKGMSLGKNGYAPLSAISYSYDKKDNIKSKYGTIGESYNYDEYDRLVSSNIDGVGNTLFGYDRIDNLVVKDNKTIGYNLLKPIAPSSFGGTAYVYDQNGGMIKRGGTSISYDQEGRVKTIGSEQYFYGDGMERTIKIEGTKKTLYFFPNYEEVYSGSTYQYSTQYYVANGTVVAQQSTNSGMQYIHTDHLGSTICMTDINGNVIRNQIYQPFGTDGKVTGSGITKYQFTGQVKDSTGLYYNHARYYDPDLGRFISVDPGIRLGLPLSDLEILNPYIYCGNNPLKFLDPTGLANIIADDADGKPVVDREDQKENIHQQNFWKAWDDYSSRPSPDKPLGTGDEFLFMGAAGLLKASVGISLAEISRATAPALVKSAARSMAIAGEGGFQLKSLPGKQGINIGRNRLSTAQLEALTMEHGVEFSLIYRTGSGINGRGGSYWLYSGTVNSVSVPLGSDVRWIYHTHPGGTAVPSGPDINVLRGLQAVGSPQQSSRIIPIGRGIVPWFSVPE